MRHPIVPGVVGCCPMPPRLSNRGKEERSTKPLSSLTPHKSSVVAQYPPLWRIARHPWRVGPPPTPPQHGTEWQGFCAAGVHAYQSFAPRFFLAHPPPWDTAQPRCYPKPCAKPCAQHPARRVHSLLLAHGEQALRLAALLRHQSLPQGPRRGANATAMHNPRQEEGFKQGTQARSALAMLLFTRIILLVTSHNNSWWGCPPHTPHINKPQLANVAMLMLERLLAQH